MSAGLEVDDGGTDDVGLAGEAEEFGVEKDARIGTLNGVLFLRSVVARSSNKETAAAAACADCGSGVGGGEAGDVGDDAEGLGEADAGDKSSSSASSSIVRMENRKGCTFGSQGTP